MPEDMEEYGPPHDGSPFSYWFPAPPPPVEHDGPTTPGGAPPRRRGRAAVAAVVAAFVLLASGVAIGYGLSPNHQRAGSGNSSATQSIASKVTPGVVDVNTFVSEGPYPFTKSNSTPLGAGTGMILTSTGEVLTNNHVIEGATSIEVTSPSLNQTWTATVLGADPSHDVALIQIQNATGLPTVAVGNSTDLPVGTGVVAIGNALGQGGSPTVTKGSVTATGRDINVGDGRGGFEHLQNLIQIDAPISPGDSGGPLVNLSGQVIGIITASAREGFGGSSSVGYAIPASDAIDVVQQVRAGHGSSSIIIGPAGFLGVQVRDLTSEIARRLGLPVSSGAFVVAVVPGTPAASAGITANSVITSINGQGVDSADSLGPALHVHKPGSSVQVTWVDGSGTHTKTVTLVAGPAV